MWERNGKNHAAIRTNSIQAGDLQNREPGTQELRMTNKELRTQNFLLRRSLSIGSEFLVNRFRVPC